MNATRDLKGKNVLVLGLGASGVAACRLCAEKGAQVTGLDRRVPGEIDESAEQLRALGVNLLPDSENLEGHADMLICSPGIPKTHPVITACAERDIPVIGEIELGYWFCPCPIVAVTGTDGKSTVVSFIFNALKEQNRPVRLAGNIGYAFCRMLLDDPPPEEAVCVLELSSYQLELIDTFRPYIAAILNIAPDHIKRHGTLDEYARAKYRILENQTNKDYFVRPVSLPGSFHSDAITLFWNPHFHEMSGCFYDHRSQSLVVKFEGEKFKIAAPELEELVPHQQENMLAALTVCLPLGLDLSKAFKSMQSFPGLPHRLEYLGSWSGVRYYNDSKATNVHACQAALKAIDAPIILLAGGQIKDEDYTPLTNLLEQKVRRVIVFGQAREILEKEWAGKVDVVSEATLEEAARIAIDQAVPGDTILLSPACASFDRFQSFEQRGNFFKSLISDWVEKKR
jgi:UDP-N-acetylmuramoylalanine--D-glutamate ligase